MEPAVRFELTTSSLRILSSMYHPVLLGAKQFGGTMLAKQ